MWAIYKKELKVYFTTILGYIIMSIYLVVAGISFYGNFIAMDGIVANFSQYFSFQNSFFIILLPLITMRIIAEDKTLGTYELLLTSPVSPWKIVIGKFLGVYTFVLASSALLLLYPLILNMFTPVEWGSVLSGFIGMMFSLGLFVAVGVASSAVASSQVVAAVIAYAVFFTMFLLNAIGGAVSGDIGKVIKELSFMSHYVQAAKGVIVAKDIMYFIICSFISLFIAKTAVESKSWK